MVVYDGELTPYVQRVTQELLYTLWDLGLQVGHSLRSLDDCVAMARTDFPSRTSMQEARFLAGDRRLFARFRRVLRENVYRRDFGQFLATTLAERDQRYRQVRGLAVHRRAERQGVGGRAARRPHRDVARRGQVRGAHAARAGRQGAHHAARAGGHRRRADLSLARAQRAALLLRPQERRALARRPAARSPRTSATRDDETASASSASCATTTCTRARSIASRAG